MDTKPVNNTHLMDIIRDQQALIHKYAEQVERQQQRIDRLLNVCKGWRELLSKAA